jgi:hypothetical protein
MARIESFETMTLRDLVLPRNDAPFRIRSVAS